MTRSTTSQAYNWLDLVDVISQYGDCLVKLKPVVVCWIYLCHLSFATTFSSALYARFGSQFWFREVNNLK